MWDLAVEKAVDGDKDAAEVPDIVQEVAQQMKADWAEK
jgi:hypothetical protein